MFTNILAYNGLLLVLRQGLHKMTVSYTHYNHKSDTWKTKPHYWVAWQPNCFKEEIGLQFICNLVHSDKLLFSYLFCLLLYDRLKARYDIFSHTGIGHEVRFSQIHLIQNTKHKYKTYTETYLHTDKHSIRKIH